MLYYPLLEALCSFFLVHFMVSKTNRILHGKFIIFWYTPVNISPNCQKIQWNMFWPLYHVLTTLSFSCLLYFCTTLKKVEKWPYKVEFPLKKIEKCVFNLSKIANVVSYWYHIMQRKSVILLLEAFYMHPNPWDPNITRIVLWLFYLFLFKRKMLKSPYLISKK